MDSINNDIDLKELEQLEDRDIQKKKKIKKEHDLASDDHLYRVKLRYNNYSKIYKSKNPEIKINELVIVPTPYGLELARIQGKTTNIEEAMTEDELLEIA
ncbi:MAG: hypothetical protein MJB14_04950, partial [Spirochaetes bacterium]|nr:hypothetical protein [Spirochaetota bacterium]